MRIYALALLPLAACSAPPPERVVVSPPAELLSCRAAPIGPAGEYSQADVARFVLRLDAAGQDCREKLEAVRRYVSQSSASELSM